MAGKKFLWFARTILVVPLISTFLLLCHLQLSYSQALKTFGEACEADCDERQLLTCSQNTSICECMLPNSRLYDNAREKCVGKAGTACARYSNNEFYCVPHSSCDRSSTLCECDKGYFQTENGTCSIMAKYGDPCSAKRPCDKSSGMTCTEKSTTSGSGSGRGKRTCQCVYPSDQYYNATAKSCISYPGGNCSFSWPCVRNAACSVDIYELRRGENIHGKVFTYNVTVGRMCACIEGFKTTRDRQCLPTFGQQCDLESPSGQVCNFEENLKCFDSSICLCKSPLSQIYERSRSKCVLLLGAPCNSTQSEGGGGGGDDDDDDNADGAECTLNAECNAATEKCECKPGFTSTPFSTCLKDFGAECGRSDGVSQRCNMHRGLVCKSGGGCGCIDDTLKYDSNTASCLSGGGGPCGTFEYFDGIGFALGNSGGGEDGDSSGEVVMRVMMGNHKRGMIRRGNGLSAGYNGTSASPPPSPTLGTTSNASTLREKVAHGSVTKIQIKCGSGLECVNEFGDVELGRCGGGGRDGNHIFQGFCRHKNSSD